MTITRYHIYCSEFGKEEEVGRLAPCLEQDKYWEIIFKPVFSRYIGYRSFIGEWSSCISVLNTLFVGFLRKY